MQYNKMTPEQLKQEKALVDAQYQELLSKNLKLNMARGVLCKEQLDLTMGMLDVLKTVEDCTTDGGTDCRNYGILDGIPEAKKLMADILEVPVENVIIGGNSSLNLMYDAVARNMIFGAEGAGEPWAKQGTIKFLCPSPGYDRHFTVTQSLGVELVTVPMLSDGPDMDMVEKLVAEDASIKGIWCVPKYSNPTGIVFSDEVIRRFAALRPAAPDFRIFWDNAYVIHDLYEERYNQLNILEEAKKYGNEDMVYIFASTSKVSFPGSGISVIASSKKNIDFIRSKMNFQTIGHDKLNQLRHVKFFGSKEGVLEHMKKHAALIAPKFDLVIDTLEAELGDLEIASWTKPMGGYFISLDVMTGTAKRVYAMMSELGINLTPAGATFPYGADPEDKNLRIAPTFPPLDELETASKALCLCAKRAALEKLIG